MEIASFIDNTLTKEEKNNFINHIVECEKCYNDILETFLLIGKEPDIEFLELDEKIKKQALSFGNNQSIPGAKPKLKSGKNKISISFAMALVIIVILVVTNIKVDKREKLFRADKIPLTMEIVSPDEGSQIEKENIFFKWVKLDSVLSYRIRIYNESGNVLFDTSLSINSIDLSSKINAQDNGKYFWDVQANFFNGNIITSRLNAFTIK